MKWAEMKINKFHNEEQRIVLQKEKLSVKGELAAGAVLGCEEPKNKIEPTE